MGKQLPVPISIDESESIRKAHQAIAIVPSRGTRITLLMRRFFNVLLHHAQDHKNRSQETYRRDLRGILAGASFESTNIEVAKATLRQMAKTPVEWNSVNDEGERSWGVSSLIAEAEIFEKGGSLFLEWSYGPKIRARLLDPELYVRLSLRMYSSLRSSTSAALYEICARYVTNHGGLTNRASWQWWRPRLTGIPDSDSEAIKEYKYFKRDTLAPAIREVNQLTDITIELIEFKEGRKIADIQFSATKKQQQDLQLDDSNLIDNQLLDRIARFGFTHEEAAKLYSSKEEATLRATVEYVEARLKKKGLPPVDSAAALFRDALRKGYGKAEVTKGKVAKITEKPPALPVKLDPEAEKQRLDALVAFDALDEAGQTVKMAAFIEANPALSKAARKNPNSKSVRTSLGGWLRTQS
jgi:hypothetical protein